MKKAIAQRAAAILLSLVASAGAHATYSCTGPVTGVTVSPQGYVTAESLAGISWGYYCHLSNVYYGVSPEACRGILALLLSAEAQGKSVEIWFEDNLSCSTRPSWAWQAGWYWGPRIVS
jgi:hypothetical protein